MQFSVVLLQDDRSERDCYHRSHDVEEYDNYKVASQLITYDLDQTPTIFWSVGLIVVEIA